MPKRLCLLLILMLALVARAGEPEQYPLEYPSALADVYDADGICWTGMGPGGHYPVPVVPDEWLIGPPPSSQSAVTIPTDHWIDLLFPGAIVDGDGNDITLTESGKAGEEALLFLSDGDNEYLLTKLSIPRAMKDEMSYLSLDLDGLALPFPARVLRLVALDRGGLSPGFDLAHIRARVSDACGPKAQYPWPTNGAVDVPWGTNLSWMPGCTADQHVIYFSAVESHVREGVVAVRFPPQVRDANVFEPPALRIGETYYWRVDELTGTGSGRAHKGDVWSFTVPDRVTIEDFDTYDSIDRPLWQSWDIRGRVSSNLSQRHFLSCVQSMAMEYRCDRAFVSEVSHRFGEPQDWTGSGAEILEIPIHGRQQNDTTAEMYLVLGDGDAEQFVPYEGDMGILTEPQWRTWQLDLADFNEIDLTHVTQIALGMRLLTDDPTAESRGTIYLDDIALLPAICEQENRPGADLTGDCMVDYRDMEEMSVDWLADGSRLHPVATPNEPILWYTFNGHAEDLAGSAHGHVEGRPNYVDGVYGQAMEFANEGDAVIVSQAPGVFAQAREGITIAFWQYGADSGHLNDTICCSNYTYGESNPAIAVHLGCWRTPGHYRWDCGSPWSFDNRLAGRHREKTDWTGRWNHWAFTKDIHAGPDGQTGVMEIYLNGVLYDRRTGTDAPITDVTSFEIGSGWYGRYDGLIDDFLIYDYALSQPEIMWVITDGTGIFPDPPVLRADLNADNRVNLRDFSILAEQWLEDALWP